MTRVFATDSEQALLSLYGSVVNEDRYLDFLDQVQQAIQSKFLVLGMFDPHDPSREVHRFAAPRTIGLDGAMQFLALAAQTHVDGSENMLSAEPMSVLLDSDFYPDHEELSARPTMQHLRDHYAATHIGVINAQENRAWVDYMVFAHDDAGFADTRNLRDSVAFFAPHISVASEIRRAFKLLEQRYQAIFAALNHLRYGVALILDNGEMLLANAAFEDILQAADGLRLQQNRTLKALSAGGEQDQVFQAVLNETIQAAQGMDTTARRTLALQRLSGAAPYILDFAPFNDVLSGELNLNLQGALLFMLDPDQSTVLSHQGLSAAFGLTPSEDNVCRQVLDGLSNQEIAEVNNTALPTVKTQVSSIFSKTRVMDRAELMRLASKVTPPVA